MKLQKMTMKNTKTGKEHVQYSICLPLRYIQHMGWQKGDRIAVALGRKDELLLRKEKPEQSEEMIETT